MSVSHKRWGVLVLVVALAALVAGCTKDDDADRNPTRNPTFRAGVVKPATLDPAQARTVDELLLADQLFDGLTAYDPKTNEPVPALAAGWVASADQQHWDFTLRKDARFTDGAAVTAADVKASLERIARKGSNSSVSDLLELVTGYAAVAVDGTTNELAGVTATAADVVRIDLDQPWSLLPSALANPAFGIVPGTSVGGAQFNESAPVGSGPFKVSTRTDAKLEVVASAGAKSKSDRMEFAFFADKAASYEAFLAGDVDWSQVPAERVREAADRFGRALFKPYVAELFYAFNLRNPKYSDPRLREAIVRAVDRDAIVRDVYGGTVRTIAGLLVDGLGGAQEGACPACAHDPARARALVDEMVAGGGTIPEVALDFEDDKTQTAVATAIKDALGTVGITAALRPKPLAEYQQFAVSGQQEIFRLGWIAPYPSPDAILTPLFLTGFPNNLTGFASTAVDEHLRAARASVDPQARLAAHKAAERAILAELPILPIAQFDFQSVASSRVRGLAVTSTGTFDARAVWVAPAR